MSKPDYTQSPYSDENGNPTAANPHYSTWKAKQMMKEQRTVNGVSKGIQRSGGMSEQGSKA
jgi:hypothetical protein